LVDADDDVATTDLHCADVLGQLLYIAGDAHVDRPLEVQLGVLGLEREPLGKLLVRDHAIDDDRARKRKGRHRSMVRSYHAGLGVAAAHPRGWFHRVGRPPFG
jgi:hypothetical protein